MDTGLAEDHKSAMMKAEEITRIARTFLNVPYRHQGKSRYGVDCWGLLYVVAEEAGVLPKGFSAPMNYGKMTDSQMSDEFLKWTSAAYKPDDGVIALIKWPGTKVAGHMGLLTSQGTIIHAYSMEKRVVEHGYRGPWLRMTHSLWKLHSLEYQNG